MAGSPEQEIITKSDIHPRSATNEQQASHFRGPLTQPLICLWPLIVGQVNFFFRVEWVELVVKQTKLSHWGLVLGHLLQNWSSAFDLKFENLSGFFCPEPSQYSTWHVSFASYRHNKLAVDGSNAHTIHAHYTDGIVSLTFTSKFFARPGFLVWSCSQ